MTVLIKRVETTLISYDCQPIQISPVHHGMPSIIGLPNIRRFRARTMQGADDRVSEWTYVPVRRLALFLEESVSRGIEWAAFEPNDETRWARLRSWVEGLLHDLFRHGAFAGERSEEAYFVRYEATTQPAMNQGVVEIAVGFAPLKPAEFVVLRIRQAPWSPPLC